MIFKNISVRRITGLTAMMVVVIFVTCYLGFKYLWSHERHVQQVKSIQAEEVVRIETLIEIIQSQMGDAMTDYAAWNDMADFIVNPTAKFIEDSIGAHAFSSQAIDGIFIFSPNEELIWGKELDYDTNELVNAERYSEYFPLILREAEQLGIEEVQSLVRFIVIKDQPYLAAVARVCDSNGFDCVKGYLIFFKKLESRFAQKVQKATGLKVDILVNKGDLLPNEAIDNISYVDSFGYSGHSSVMFKVYHSIKLPTFIVKEEIYALFIFSVLFYFINLFLANYIVTPITNARLVLEKFQAQGGMIPDESYFVSKEMKGFARSINRIMTELEESREDLRWQSEHDPLTQISNRRHLEARLTAFIKDYQYSFIALYLVDIDYFKLYNDNLGHPEGDNALKAVAATLNKINYRGDKIVARFGGEEFCVVLASDKPIDIEAYGQLLKDTVDDLEIPHPYSQLEEHKFLSISIGGIQITQPSIENYQDFFHQADQALYAAKKQGRNQYVVRDFEKKSND